ncbi:MAG: hypothetical protein QOJ91_1604 [Sphingomonadales bacterium]|jgi:hypothetical protein|nr:hypothetical protein [Sphingomonadales bacterium]
MRRSAFAFALLALAAVPAAAQIAGRHDYGPVPPSSPFLPDSRLPGPGIGREVRDVEGRIDRARKNGSLSRIEARRLDREARAIDRLAELYGRDGLSPSERAELDNRTNYLRDSVNRPKPAAKGRRGSR